MAILDCKAKRLLSYYVANSHHVVTGNREYKQAVSNPGSKMTLKSRFALKIRRYLREWRRAANAVTTLPYAMIFKRYGNQVGVAVGLHLRYPHSQRLFFQAIAGIPVKYGDSASGRNWVPSRGW
jgi:hypothetical protein